MKGVTIGDVAAASGVSPTTVSHVFSGRRPINATTRQHVEEVARRLGYRPNGVAQSLRTRRTNTVMVVVPDITNPFYPDFARGVQDVVGPAGYHCLFCNTDAREAEELALLEVAMSRRLDGLIFNGFRVPDSELLPVTEAGLAVVNLGSVPLPDSTIDSVCFENPPAIAEATRFLVERYGPSIAFIYAEAEARVGKVRRAGFEEACRELGVRLGPDDVVLTEFTRDGGVEGMRRLLDRPDPPRSVQCANDMIAFGAMDVARERGLRIPEDVAIVGFDDVFPATLVSPRLTTVRTDARRFGAEAGRLLLSRMTGEYDGAGRHVVIPHELVVRESA
ncbi:LacI family DNA-binding transcriptional regulator [Asanoa iriomotensis]|uniref:Catabolite control protein A n=1 Tax=Asanoa iriomotensis TaxID=234613 RepID=A0ABQ4BX85_9ACTN|nr:LacI family DNA-binding transcriptional regulator [Asanoa iriomotensis]GIF55138.1 catabolite control protein A [Asanoa iriomotensis]